MNSLKGFKAPITEMLVVILVIMIASVPITKMFIKARADVAYAEKLSTAVADCRSAAEYFKATGTVPADFIWLGQGTVPASEVFGQGSRKDEANVPASDETLKLTATINGNEVLIRCYDESGEEIYSLRAATMK